MELVMQYLDKTGIHICIDVASGLTTDVDSARLSIGRLTAHSGRLSLHISCAVTDLKAGLQGLVKSLPNSFRPRVHLWALEVYGRPLRMHKLISWANLKHLLLNIDSPTAVVGRKGWEPIDLEWGDTINVHAFELSLPNLTSLESLVWCENSRLVQEGYIRKIGSMLASGASRLPCLKRLCFYNDSGGHHGEVYGPLSGHHRLKSFLFSVAHLDV